MVLLVEKLGRSLKLCSKLQNHLHHNRPNQKVLTVSMQAFESEISKCLSQLSLSSNPRSEILTFSWIQRCLQLLPAINMAFAKLVVDMDYPMSKWERGLVERYLNYSLKLLELLNSISSALSYLGQARVSLSHALSLLEKSPSLAVESLKTIRLRTLQNCRVVVEEKEGDEREERCCSSNELVIYKALSEMKSISFWVCGVVVSSLCGDTTSCLEMEKGTSGFDNSTLQSLNSSFCEEMMVTGGVLKEVKELNVGVASLIADFTVSGGGKDKVMELRERVQMLGKLLEGVGEDVNKLFSEVLVGRNELLNNLRQSK